MDITLNSRKRFTTKYINGETVNYTLIFSISCFVLITVKQLLKTFIGLDVRPAVTISFIIFELLLYFLEKFFVFNKNILSSSAVQIVFFIVRGAVNFGFYELFNFLFVKNLNLGIPFCWLCTGILCYVFNYYFDKGFVFNCISNPKNNLNGRLYRKFFSNRFVFASMGAAAFCLFIVYIIYKMFPFGDMTVLRMDLYHQYGPLFTELFDRITQGKSFFYSLTSGGGSSFLGNFFNYLSSPLSLIILLFDRKDMPYAITALVAVKGILSAGTFTYYIKSSLKRHSLVTASFGVLYAFCAYYIAYYWNVMWLDGMILLPLVVLGIERIINKGSKKLYIASLTLLLFCSYYIGFMTCIFSILYFIVYFLSKYNFNDNLITDLKFEKKLSVKALSNNRFLSSGVSFAFSSIVSALLSCAWLVPVYFILKSCSATSDSFPSSFTAYYDLFDFVQNHLAALTTTIRSSGDSVLPNVYCGILTALLIPLYFLNKNIRLREKACYLVLILLFAFSFDNNCANFVWHAFHFPNDLPYRFSFMYSFILLIMGIKTLMNFKGINYKDIAGCGLLFIFFILLCQKIPNNYIAEYTVYISIAFVIIWTAALLLITKKHLTQICAGGLILTLAVCEVISADTGAFEFTQMQEDYVADYDAYMKATDEINKDNGLFRSELCYLNTRMDPCLYNYNGVSVFSSMAYESLSGLQYNLGMYGNRINSYTYNNQTPIYNMMFGIKYLIYSDNMPCNRPSAEYFTKFCELSDYETEIYENDYCLPFAFSVNNAIKDWMCDEGDPFEVQEDFFKKATGYGNVFVPVNYESCFYENASGDDVIENGTFFYTNDEESTSGEISITVNPAIYGDVYLYVTSPDAKFLSASSEEMSVSQDIETPYILDLGTHTKDEEINVCIDLSEAENTDSYIEIYAYSLDKNVFEAGYNSLKCNSLEVSEFSETKISGTINAKGNQYIFTSIPYDEGWTVFIDGKKSQTFEIGYGILGTAITQGEHTVEFRYCPKGIKIGLSVSAVSFTGLGIYLIVSSRKRKNKINL